MTSLRQRNQPLGGVGDRRGGPRRRPFGNGTSRLAGWETDEEIPHSGQPALAGVDGRRSRLGPCPTAWTRSSVRCRSPPSPTPRSAAPARAGRSTPTCASSGSSPRRSRCATARSPASPTRRSSAWPSGCWWTACGGSPRTATSRRSGPRPPPSRPSRWRAPSRPSRGSGWSAPTSPSTPTRCGSRPTRSTRSTCPRADKVALLTEWSHRLLASDGRRPRPDRGSRRSGRASSTPTSRAPRPRSSGCGPPPTLDRDGRRPRHGRLRDHGLPGPPAGRGLGVPHRRRLGLRGRAGATIPELLAEKMKAPSASTPAVRPGRRPDQPVAHHPRVDRPRHRARPRHRLRGGLRGHQSFATPDKLGTLRYGSAADARHRRPHDRPRPGHHRLRRRRRRRAELGPRPRRRARGLPARPHAWPAALGLAALQRLRVRRLARTTCRSSGWPMSRCSPTPDGPDHRGARRAASSDGIYVVGDKSWSIDMQRYNFQFTGQRFFRIENGPAGRAAARRRLPGDHHRLLGLDGRVGGPSTYVLGGAFNCGKGQPGQVAAVQHGCPSAPFRGVNMLNTRAGRPADDALGARLRAAGDRRAHARGRRAPDGCVVLVREHAARPCCAGPTRR